MLNNSLRSQVAIISSFFVVVMILAGATSSLAQMQDSKVLQLLDVRKQEQLRETNRNAFYGFQFADRCPESGITFEHHVVDDAGKNYKPVHYDHGNGLAVADVDGDGRLDVYFTTQLGQNELWRNTGGGKFENLTGKAGLALTDQVSVAASFADIDNDGDPDLFVTTVRHGNHLFENTGGGRFRDITKDAGVLYNGHSSGTVFFDFDNDSLLDMFLCNVGVYTTNEKGRGGYFVGFKDGFSGHLFPERTEYSLLYKNLGGRKFKEVSKEVELVDGSWSGDATFVDLNKDRFPDLYVLNMQGDDHYYENQAGKRFVEKTAAYFPKTPWGAMGIKFFDFNQDGLMDLFITDMHSDMTDSQTRTSKTTLAWEFEKKKSEAWCAIQWTDTYLQGASNNIFGNAFYQNLGQGKFVEGSDKVGAETFWPWGVSVGDLNADGYEDMFVTAGMGFGFRYALNSLLLNEGGRSFTPSELVLGVEPRRDGRISKTAFVLDCSRADKTHPLCSGRTGRTPAFEAKSTRSSVIFDLDDDGDLDIVTSEMNDRPQVLVSNLADSKKLNYLKIKLVGAASNRDGLGATVKVHAGSKIHTQYNDGKSGYFSQSALPLYFGLDNVARADRVEVHWPSGTEQVVTSDIPANTLFVIREPRK